MRSSPWPARYFIKVRHRSPRELPSSREVLNAITDVRFGNEQIGQRSPVAEHFGRHSPDLHKAELSHFADRTRIVPALDPRDGIGDRGRQATLFRLSRQQGEVVAAPGRTHLRQDRETARGQDGSRPDARPPAG